MKLYRFYWNGGRMIDKTGETPQEAIQKIEFKDILDAPDSYEEIFEE
jgi:hypothetical protein